MIQKPYMQSVDTTPVSKPSGPDKQFLHTYTAGALLPFTQASITALLIFTGAYAISYFVLELIDPIKPAIVLAVLAWIAAWFTRQNLWITLARFEKATGIDLNQDGVIGEDEHDTPVTVIRIDDVKANGHYQSNTYNLPASEDQLEQLAIGLTKHNRPFSRREWTTRSRVFSDGEFRALQSVMIRNGLIEPNSDRSINAGYVLTRSGMALMEHYAPLTSPTEIGEVVEE